MNTEKIGSLIYSLRTERELTQKQLADALGIEDYAYSFNYKLTGDGLISFDIYLDYPEELLDHTDE